MRQASRENALNRGRSLAYAMKEFVHSEKAAFRAVLGETRPGVRGWWNSFEEPDKEARDSEVAGELMWAVCDKTSDEVETLVRYEGKFVCESCLRGLLRSLSHRCVDIAGGLEAVERVVCSVPMDV